MAQDDSATLTAPYLPWSTFTGFVSELKQKGAMPDRIDASLLTTKSGGVQAQLRGALRFLGLVTGSGANLDVTQSLRDLVAASGTAEWKQALQLLLKNAYGKISGEIDVTRATQKQLEEAFSKHGGVTGASPIEKAARFYLAMMKEAGETLSPHFKPLRSPGVRRPPNGKKRRASSDEQKSVAPTGTSPHGESSDGRPEGQLIKPLPDQEFSVFLPNSMTEEEVQFAIEHLLGYLKLRKQWFKGVRFEFDSK